MTRQDLRHMRIPTKPGVYFFLGAHREILYIGKATSLSSRIRSYFDTQLDEKRGPLIARMVREAQSVIWTTTDSVLEALLLESNLIRTHKPRYNVRARDDKSYNHLVITDEPLPRVLVMRGKDLATAPSTQRYRKVYGPFSNGVQFREALKIIRKLFKVYDLNVPVDKVRSRVTRGVLDFNRQLGLYPQYTSSRAYREHVRHLELFLDGKKTHLINELTNAMLQCAAEERFEEAAAYKRQLFAMKHIDDTSLIRNDVRTYRDDRVMRIEAYDIAHLAGTAMVGVLAVIEHHLPATSQYRTFTIRSLSTQNDIAALTEIITRRLRHPEWPLPQLIVVDGGNPQLRAATKVLERSNMVIPVVAVVKDDRHKPHRLLGPRSIITRHKTDILLANAEAHRRAMRVHVARRNANFLPKTPSKRKKKKE